MNISSGLTRIIYPGRIAYGSMKGAVEVMTRYMAKELGPLAFIRDLENGARG